MKTHVHRLALRQRGAATIAVVLGLLAAVLLATIFASRGLLLEIRMAANQARSTIAFEAAEAGLEWAAAQLNTLERIGADCRPEPAGTASFREHYLTIEATTFLPRVAPDGTPLRAACTRGGGGWQCHCPDAGPPMPAASADADPAGFVVEFLPDGQPGVVRVASRGRASGSGAVARVEAAYVLRPALAGVPAAVVTARGAIVAGTEAIGLHNPDAASAGLALHAGGPIDTPAARITTAAGGSLDGTLAGRDAALAALSADRFFAAHFGMPRTTWARLPTVHTLACADDCTNALAAAIGADVVRPMVRVAGDAELDGPVTFGRPDRPVVLVVDGRLDLRGPVTLHGVVVANEIVWSGTPGGELHGALLDLGDLTTTTVVDLHRDAAVLAGLTQRTGTFVRVPGSWRDF